jgi:hypothetical protein
MVQKTEPIQSYFGQSERITPEKDEEIEAELNQFGEEKGQKETGL